MQPDSKIMPENIIKVAIILTICPFGAGSGNRCMACRLPVGRRPILDAAQRGRGMPRLNAYRDDPALRVAAKTRKIHH